MLTDKTVVLGVSGGIAAYKVVDLASKLVQAGARVEVIMTKAATEFVTPITFRAITHRSIVTDMFDTSTEFSIEHVALSELADVVVIAPATADIIARMAHGLADDMLTTTVLATKAPVIVAAAMNDNMWANPITQENVAELKGHGFIVIEPEYGRLASGKIGQGRLVPIEQILGTVQMVLGQNGDLAGQRIVVTAGGTQEPIDPVRVITNRSSGKMGYAIAEAARDRGAIVTLVTAPTSLSIPAGVNAVHVHTTTEMKDAVARTLTKTDVLIMAAAPADYQAKTVAEQKIKKSGSSLTLELVRTPDILSEVSGKFIKVGFAAESENLVANAKSKLEKKSLDLIVANDITAAGAGFEVDTNKVILIDKSGKTEDLPLLTKREVADKILDRVIDIMRKKK